MIEAPLMLDFYKTGHHKFYKPGMLEVYSNFTARNGKHSNIKGSSTCLVAGLQAFIGKIIEEEWGKFFNADTEDEAVEAYEQVVSHGLGRKQHAQHLRDLWQLGYLPLEFKGLPEGLEVSYGIPHFTVRSTVSGFGWLTNMIETVLSAEVWPVQTALTTANAYRKVFEEYAEITGSPQEMVPFQGHDFSLRGMMGVEAAKLTGMGHLMSGFKGSDSIPSALSLHKYYGADLDPENPCTVISSVDATEHSTQCSFNEDDEAYIDHCMDVACPEGMLSLVSDGYDFWKLVTEYIPARKEKILNRNGKIIIRPDSGDPADILCGLKVKTVSEGYLGTYPEGHEEWKSWVAEEMNEKFTNNLNPTSPHSYETEAYRFEDKVYQVTYTPDLNRHDKTYYYVDNYGSTVSNCEFKEIELNAVQKGLVEFLWDTFGGTITDKGYKVLDSHIGCIYGDSITLDRQKDILQRLADKGFASCNVVLGIGSYTYQYVTRDTHGSAVKATSIVMKEEGRVAIAKDPKTGDGSKKSAKGLLYVGRTVGDGVKGKITLEDNVSEDMEKSPHSLLQTVWKDGEWVRKQTLEEIREIVRNN